MSNLPPTPPKPPSTSSSTTATIKTTPKYARLTSFRRANSARRNSHHQSTSATTILPSMTNPTTTNSFQVSSSNDNKDKTTNMEVKNIMVSAFEYKGLELIITAQNHNDDNDNDHKRNCINLITARSRMVLQTLYIDEHQQQQYGDGDNDNHNNDKDQSVIDDKPKIVTIKTNSITGCIAIITSNCKCIIYYPIPTTSSKSTMYQDRNISTNTIAFGNHYWIQGHVISLTKTFVTMNDDTTLIRKLPALATNPKSKASTSDIAKNYVFLGLSSIDHKLLIGYDDQIAIYYIPYIPSILLSLTKKNPILQWTTRVSTKITNCDLSGDGRSIVYTIEKEGVGVQPYSPGIRTFIRDIKNDGSLDSQLDEVKATVPKSTITHVNSSNDDGEKKNTKKNESIIYKPGPFLVHSNPVSRLSFRGYGMNYSSIITDYDKSRRSLKKKDVNSIIEGNDLLLTNASDGSMRVFSQGTWKLLLYWDAPTGSRADWIQGISMANLGDLDPFPKSTKKKMAMSSAGSVSSEKGEASNRRGWGTDKDKKVHKSMSPRNGSTLTQVSLPTSPTTTASSGWNTHQSPQCAAGAWISELTFKGSFPALRLSRLSFLQSGGGDTWAPAHFESVAAILPPATILPQAVLESFCGDEGLGMVVQGVWPAWNRWVANPNSQTGAVEDESLSGNAMALIGAMPQGMAKANLNLGIGVGGSDTNISAFGGTGGMSMASFGGSHSPPSELRLISSHPDGDTVVVMDFPLWGDSEFGAMELGSPLRHVLSLKEEVPDDVIVHYRQDTTELPLTMETSTENLSCVRLPSHAPLPVTISTRCACLDFESNNLCAVVSKNRRHIGLTWRKKGTMNIVKENPAPLGDFETLKRTFSGGSIASTISLDSNESHSSFVSEAVGAVIDQFSDFSLIPLPLSLPKLHLPSTTLENEHFSLLKWWPDENFGGPPRLFALTNLGTLILYEMPPPWSALEPIMPMDDPFSTDKIGSEYGTNASSVVSERSSVDEEAIPEAEVLEEYDVQVTPHPDFGLGLRLKAQSDGMPAVVGSFKKNPLTGGRLPSERTGKIVLGDELISINDISLGGMTFDEIISSVREIGSRSQGGPLNIKLRPVQKKGISRESSKPVTVTEEEGLEVIHHSSNFDVSISKSSASNTVGANDGIYEGFGRIIAVISDALPSFIDDVNHSPRSLLLLPWHYGKGAPLPYENRGAVILVSAVGRTITASRLELQNDRDTHTCGVLSSLGKYELQSEKDKQLDTPIKSLEIIKNSGDGWCIAACDEAGDLNFVFIDIVDNDNLQSNKFEAVFRTDFILNCLDQNEKNPLPVKDFLVRAPSIEVIGTMPIGMLGNMVKVWTPAPYVQYQKDNSKEPSHDEHIQNYTLSRVYHRGDASCNKHHILDFRWIPSGHVDAYPWLVTFSDTSAVIHRRPCLENEWVALAEFSYPVQSRSYDGSLSPADAYPHMTAAFRSAVTTNDEQHYLKSDWNPDCMLAVICSDSEGVENGMKRHLNGLLNWLSKWMDPTDTTISHWDKHSKLPCAPFETVYNRNIARKNIAETYGKSAASLMQTLSINDKSKSQEDLLLLKFQNCLKNIIHYDTAKNMDPMKSLEFKSLMNQIETDSKSGNIEEYSLPDPIKSFSQDELRLLFILSEMVLNPPNFQKLDESAKLAFFAVSLLQQSQEGSEHDTNGNNVDPRPIDHLKYSRFLEKSSSSKVAMSSKSLVFPEIASSATLSALLSDTQNQLVQYCRPSNTRFDWDTVRAINLPLWLRSDDELRKISQEVGQSTYKNTMDVLEAALFYIVIGNIKMLKTIAATDKNLSGKTFFNFLTNHDFSSQPGRTAAEKNAFSLLRKRRYRPAVAFFLLAQPPMLNTALEVIITKLEDFPLAFFVARLVEKFGLATQNACNNSGALTIGGGLNLHRMGGGGGFASIDTPLVEDLHNEVPYNAWAPQLSKASKSLVEKYGLDASDECKKAVQLLWLGRRNDAAMCLLEYNMASNQHRDRKIESDKPSVTNIANVSNVVADANAIINFTSRPLILKKMKVPKHVLWFSSLQIARTLYQRGFELSSIMTLSHTEGYLIDESKVIENVNVSAAATSNQDDYSSTISVKTQQATSSIFDDFDIPSKPQKSVSNSQPPQPSSSIFDAFDPVPQTNTTKDQTVEAEMTSSIFDSFDVPNKSNQPSSSIFDAYELPSRNTTKTNDPVHSSEMTSSIFDTFDVPTQVAKTKPSQRDVPMSNIRSDISTLQSMETESDYVADSLIVDAIIPPIWNDWKRSILTSAVARRLLREMARIISPILADSPPVSMKLFRRHIQPLVPFGASHVFQDFCNGETLLSLIVEYLDQLCTTFCVSKDSVIEQALLLLACPNLPHRIVFAVLIHCLTARADLAEDVMRHAAHDQIQRCESFIAANDNLVEDRKTKHHTSSQYIRRLSASISFQLELCLWLHRGGAFPISGLALKESIVAARIGMVVAAWGRCHDCLESIVKYDPDCPMDFERGRQLWSSMKIILSDCTNSENDKAGSETTSGGWEFLVDCNRKEATELLKTRKCGSFLLRPHTDDHGVFTLSFRTNLTTEAQHQRDQTPKRDIEQKSLKGDDIVQHAVVRLSDAGFKCGSFGPFSSLLKLLEAVSASLPFELLFSEPPAQGIIKEEGGKPSPNSAFFRKIAFHSKTDHYKANKFSRKIDNENEKKNDVDDIDVDNYAAEIKRDEVLKNTGMFSQLLVLTELRKQFSAIVAADYDKLDLRSHWDESKNIEASDSLLASFDDIGEEEMDAMATRIIRPFLSWSRSLEMSIVHRILPFEPEVSQFSSMSSDEIPQSPRDSGDGIIRRMIQPKSGVDFRTLRVGEAGHSAVIVLFRKSEAVSWIISSGAEKNEADAIAKLDLMEKLRVIEQVDLSLFAPEKQIVGGAFGQNGLDSVATEKDVRFRFVDPWEVEVIESKDAELRSAALGRDHYVPFSIGLVARACSEFQQVLGGQHLLSLWNSVKGGVCLTKTIASVFPPWERDAGGDLNVVNGMVTQPSSYSNSFRQHLYRNSLFRRLNMPQRFIALIQVELLDLKNLTSRDGSPSLTAYALLRLKRDASNAPLTHKARTLDSVATEPKKISKGSKKIGPNPTNSWGSVVRFRFPLPEGVNCDGVSFDKNREALFKGAPSVLQLSVYEKKFMNDVCLGGADVKFDGLSTDSQVEEWVPLQSAGDDITWFAKIRLMLRFELMCIDSDATRLSESAGLKKIQLLSKLGGAHEDAKGFHKSFSTPDLVHAFQNMV